MLCTSTFQQDLLREVLAEVHESASGQEAEAAAASGLEEATAAELLQARRLHSFLLLLLLLRLLHPLLPLSTTATTATTTTRFPPAGSTSTIATIANATTSTTSTENRLLHLHRLLAPTAACMPTTAGAAAE